MNLRIISAGAGSGKTYRLTSEMVELLKKGVRPSGIIATTFTNKAAAELKERVRVRLLEDGMSQQADELTNALIGTVHSLGVKLLQRFAYEAGVSPEVSIIADEDQQIMFNQALATVLTIERVSEMERLSDRLGLNKRERYDWREEVKRLTDMARANDFSIEVLEKSKVLSFKTFQEFLGEQSDQPEAHFQEELEKLLADSIQQIEANEDATKKTQSAVNTLKNTLNELRLREELYWHQWVKVGKIDTGAKSRDEVVKLKEFAQTHDTHPGFHQDIQEFIYSIFDIAIEAIREYDAYKKSRGLIDYTDMEVHIKRLLENERVKEVLKEELDLLMVDEFQDTSPIQLEIFLRLSSFADHSVWVGDPKQSIYGFRGADPELMQAVIRKTGGVKPEDIQEHSWRSREDIVFATNALFTKAFTKLPVEQVALKPKRTKKATDNSINKTDEPIQVGSALHHWHFEYDGEGRRIPGRPWTENCIAESLRIFLDKKVYILPKGEKKYRQAKAGDVAILCRSNYECEIMAEALHRSGIKASISRSGLLNTAEAKLILACLKYILNHYDSLSVAEILLLAGNLEIEQIIEDRLEYLARYDSRTNTNRWAEDTPFISQLNDLREKVVDLSSAETLDLLLEELDLRRIIATWGNLQQRLDNVDVLRKLSLQYEEACNRLHSAASLGGFLLWLNDLESSGNDQQGAGGGPDSVNVLTYHKSKGLEWPIVICHSLEGRLRADVWGFDIISESDEIDLNNVLGNRWLRYWVNPYSDQYRNTPVEERINVSEAKKRKTESALQEEARLLYVGITRARDYLVFPSTTRPTRWLNRVWHQGEEDLPTLDENSYESPWEWKGQFLNIETETFPYPRDFTHSELPLESILFIEQARGRRSYQPFEIEPREDTSVDSEFSIRVGQEVQYLHPYQPEDEAETYTISKMLKAYFTGDQATYDNDQRLEMAKAFVDRFELEREMDAKVLVERGNAWQNHLQRNFTVKTIHKKYPLLYYHGDRYFKKVIDIVLETDRGIFIIQHSGFMPSKKNSLHNKARELASWFYLSKKGIQSVFGEANVRTMVHFVMSGKLIEVELEGGKKARRVGFNNSAMFILIKYNQNC